MSYFSCNWPDDHKKEGREDFERRGRYGYDSFKYDDPFNDCNRAYTDGFNEARREDDLREERREEDRREEQRYERQQSERRRMMRDQEEEEYDRYVEADHPNQSQPAPKDDLPF